jgi:hypothetical protein
LQLLKLDQHQTFIAINQHADNKAAIAGSGYFNDVEGLITTGDWIYTYGSDGGQTLVATNTAGVITTAVI